MDIDKTLKAIIREKFLNRVISEITKISDECQNVAAGINRLCGLIQKLKTDLEKL